MVPVDIVLHQVSYGDGRQHGHWIRFHKALYPFALQRLAHKELPIGRARRVLQKAADHEQPQAAHKISLEQP